VAGNVRIAVIMATHNRRDLTSVFLDSLRAQRLPPGVQVSAFVTDDGSQDGTLELLHEAAVVQRVLESDGTLYWAGSMAWAERVARQSRPDYLLWLNDDVVLDADAVDRVLGLALDEPGAVIVGATRDPVSGVVTYGGRRLRGRHPQRFDQLPISDSPQECDTFNGNCVLVPRAVYELLDGIDGEFAHAYADDDYGMRARRQGVHVLQCPGSIGSCQANVPPTRASRSAGSLGLLPVAEGTAGFVTGAVSTPTRGCRVACLVLGRCSPEDLRRFRQDPSAVA
jgi:GT2 family glycosyltransferase